MQTIKAALLSFGMVFGTGFVLGTVRTLWLVPRVGTRIAELMEQPFMLVVTVVAARSIVRHLAVPSLSLARVEMGGIALALLLAAEFGLVTWLRGIPAKEYLATRDPCQERSITLCSRCLPLCRSSWPEDEGRFRMESSRHRSNCTDACVSRAPT